MCLSSSVTSSETSSLISLASKSDPSFLCTIFLHSTHFMTLFPVFFVSLFTVCLSSYTISNREVETMSILFTLVSPALFQEYSDLIMRVCLMHAL